ncbi:hypothetical protein PIB30_060316 [Stylosanthes scabra]|uniref:Dof-type domain-containing protein n=1 Tax=Stylosanthes scabra TaxID=79078 RepID=A0ABU6TMM8_9FABA|nr:hypothetical protein [Stylosanthes scabra]
MSGAGDMSDKDPGIMLFGMKIPLQEFQIPAATSQMGCQIQANFAAMNPCSSMKKTEVETDSAQNSEQSKNTCGLSQDTKQESKNNEQGNELKPNSKPLEDNEESSSNTDQEKSFKKPDKILHCPRCNSLETKFCYFNNYNVNQPRHFCKNCQRYWTAGGTMRNVPVGAGRRKNKHLASQFRHIIVASEGASVARLEAKDHSSTDNSAVLKFSPDVPLCESMESMLNLRDQKASGEPARSLSSAENHDQQELSFCASSSSSSSVANSCNAGNESLEQKCNYPVPPPWIFSWNPGWNNGGSMMAVHQSPAAMQWCPATIMGVPTVSPQKIPLQFVHGSYWNGTPVWPAQNGCLSPSSTTTSNSCCSGNGASPALGKHTRDNSVFMEEEEKSEICVLVPKTLRIDGPNEKASTRSMMKHDKHLCESENGGLKKEQGNERVLCVSQVLEANPAAVSRAHAFQEST